MRPRAQRPPIARRSETTSIDVSRLEPPRRVTSGAQDRQPHRFLRSAVFDRECRTENGGSLTSLVRHAVCPPWKCDRSKPNHYLELVPVRMRTKMQAQG